METSNKADEPTINYLGDMQKLTLGPNDLIVITTEQMLSQETIRYLQEEVKKSIPNNNCLVFAGGLKVGVIAHESFDEPTGQPKFEMMETK